MLTKLVNAFTRTKQATQAPFGFHGGLALATSKRALLDGTSSGRIVDIPTPPLLVLPLVDYLKQQLSPQVSVNDVVMRGQALATGIASPVSGTVRAIELRDMIHPSGLPALSIVIDNDSQDTQANETPPADLSPQEKIAQFVANPQSVLDSSALAGLGGAGFPTAVKLDAVQHSLQTLIINAAECEPEIACDEALMESEPAPIVHGIDALAQLTQCKQCIVAIEDSKPAAIESMSRALAHCHASVQLMIIPTRYPTGAESPLIETVTGQFIPHSEKPIAHGVLCVNVATAHALWQAINGQALDTRIVSLGGAAMPNPCNVRVRFGTSVSYLLQATGNAQAINEARIRAGGPLSGFDLHKLDATVTAKTNCILAEPPAVDRSVQACIRCGQCADVCPAQLLPQQLHWYALADELEKCAKLNIDACIECGCCDVVCPSSIKLTETFRYAKSMSRQLQFQQLEAQLAEQRFQEREQRLLHREQARQAAIEKRKQTVKSINKPDANQINAALARAKLKRKASKDQ